MSACLERKAATAMRRLLLSCQPAYHAWQRAQFHFQVLLNLLKQGRLSLTLNITCSVVMFPTAFYVQFRTTDTDVIALNTCSDFIAHYNCCEFDHFIVYHNRGDFAHHNSDVFLLTSTGSQGSIPSPTPFRHR